MLSQLKSREQKMKAIFLGGTVIAAAVGAAAVAFAADGSDQPGGRLGKALKKNLPNTQVTAIDCGADAAPKGFCEVVAGRNVFYSTPDGRFILVGQVLDLEKKIDLTDRRLREIAGVANAEDKIAGRLAEAPQLPPTQGQPQGPRQAPESPASVLKVTLPTANAVVHNRGAKLKLTVFADYNCSFCQRLYTDLKNQTDIEVTEYPIAVLGSDSEAKAKSVLCASDRAGAADAVYVGGTVRTQADCSEGEKRLRENLAFAQQHGINGTPMLVRADGATNSGWMPADKLRAWLSQARG